MHCARSEAHFDLMARVGLAVARYGCRGYAVFDLLAFRGKGEEENAAWLEDSYCRAPWNGWWAGASEETGVTCSNNDIESFWRKLKTSMLTARRVGHRQLLEEVFPKMLFLVAQEHVGDPTRTSSHVSADTLNAASAIYNGSKTPIWQHAHGTWLVNSQAYKAVRAWRHSDSFRMSTLQVAITQQRVLDFWSLTADKDMYQAHVARGAYDWDARITELGTSKSKKTHSHQQHVTVWEAMCRASQLHLVQYRRGFVQIDPETQEVVLDTGNYLESLRCDCLKDQHQGVCSHKMVVSLSPPPGAR